MNKSSNWESTVKPVVVLSVIALVVSLLLAIVNSMTAPVIAANERAATLAAYVEVMPNVSDASTLEELTGYTTANVSGAVKAEDGRTPQRDPDGKKPSIRAQLKADRAQSCKPQQREKEQEAKRSIRQALEME